MVKKIKLHPGANPIYGTGMAARKDAQDHNRQAKTMNLMARTMATDMVITMVAVPKQPNKYVPHYGAKEAAKYAALAPHRLGAAPPPVKKRRARKTESANV